MAYKIKKIPGSKNNKEPNIRWPKGMRYSQKYTEADPPCESAWEHEKTGRCPTQLAYAQGQPYVRFCTRQGNPGLMIPVNSITEGVKKGREICNCWRETDDFDQCLVDAGLEDQIKLGGAAKMRQRRSTKRVRLGGLGLSGGGQAKRIHSRRSKGDRFVIQTKELDAYSAHDPRRAIQVFDTKESRVVAEWLIHAGPSLDAAKLKMKAARRHADQLNEAAAEGKLGRTPKTKSLIVKPRPTRMDGVGRTTDSWITCKRVGKLTAAKERKLPDKAFGLPESRKYPMPDPSHAKNAKARARQMLNKKKLSRKDYDRIVRKADRVINKCRGGK